MAPVPVPNVPNVPPDEPRGTLRVSDETHCFVLEMEDDPTPIEVANYR